MTIRDGVQKRATGSTAAPLVAYGCLQTMRRCYADTQAANQAWRGMPGRSHSNIETRATKRARVASGRDIASSRHVTVTENATEYEPTDLEPYNQDVVEALEWCLGHLEKHGGVEPEIVARVDELVESTVSGCGTFGFSIHANGHYASPSACTALELPVFGLLRIDADAADADAVHDMAEICEASDRKKHQAAARVIARLIDIGRSNALDI